MHCHGCSVITAITAQNSCGVSAIWPIEAERVEYQLLSVLEDLRPDAVKIGMLPDETIVNSISRILRAFDVKNIVVDPLLAPTFGRSFTNNQIILAMYRQLFPLASLITPNLPEIECFTKVTGELAGKLGTAVLVKGGHAEDETVTDILTLNRQNGTEEIIIKHPRIQTRNTHGSGCVLSSAIACSLASGENLVSAVKKGISFVAQAFDTNKNVSFGKCGYGPALI